ncbi:MAG: TIM barrel protein [Anaerolineae bacterium]|nr:TIM barrel protein [Anaerolineae bacterium]
MPIKVASAPVSWGIYEFEGIEPKFPYTQVLDEIAETGHTGMELGPWGYMPTDPTILRAELDQRGLQLLSSFVPVKLVDASAHGEAEAFALKVGALLAELGANYVVLADDNGTVPELTKKAGQRTGTMLDAGQWDVVASGVNHIARKIKDELGLHTVFHHHSAGYIETPDEVRELFKRTDPDLVGLCLDTGHWHFGGGDAVACIQEFGERVRYLHLKDYDPAVHQRVREEGLDYFQAVQAGIFCELGKGAVDFPAVIAEMEKLGYDGWAIVEQDVLTEDATAPKKISQANRDYLKSIGL